MRCNGLRPDDVDDGPDGPAGDGASGAGEAGALFLNSEDKSSGSGRRHKERRAAAGQRIVAAMRELAHRYMVAADEARSNLDCNYPDERCYLELIGEANVWRVRAHKVSECGKLRAIPYQCKNGHRWEVAPMGCNLRCCPFCERKAAAHGRDRLAQLLGAFKNPVRLLTLTIRNYPTGSLVQMLNDLTRFWDRFRKSAVWKAGAAGAVAVFECTVSEESGWHAHIHVAWDGKFMPWRGVLAAWQTATGGVGQRVDLRRGHWAKSAAVRYLSKYVSKGVRVVDLPEDLVGEFVKAWWRFRTLRSYGTMFKVKVVKPRFDGARRCPECGEVGEPLIGVARYHADNNVSGLRSGSEEVYRDGQAVSATCNENDGPPPGSYGG